MIDAYNRLRPSRACGDSGVLRSTLVVWGALEASLVFTLPVRLLSSLTVPKGMRKRGALLLFRLSFFLGAEYRSPGVGV